MSHLRKIFLPFWIILHLSLWSLTTSPALAEKGLKRQDYRYLQYLYQKLNVNTLQIGISVFSHHENIDNAQWICKTLDQGFPATYVLYELGGALKDLPIPHRHMYTDYVAKTFVGAVFYYCPLHREKLDEI